MRIIRACREMGICARSRSIPSAIARRCTCATPTRRTRSAERAARELPAHRHASSTRRARSGADAVHPGYGFLAENEAFAAAVRDAGLTFIGPTPEAIALMGSKTAARAAAQRAGVPVVPGTETPLGADVADAEIAAMAARDRLSAAGEGGRRRRRQGHADRRPIRPSSPARCAPRDRKPAPRSATPPSISSAGSMRPRHIEVQLLGDQHGTVLPFVERECSIQRRHRRSSRRRRRSPSSPALRAAMTSAAAAVARAVGYTNAGTIEFLLDEDGRFYFLEMNTRLQVEHPITEMVTGVDLVRWQIRIARGERLDLDPDAAADAARPRDRVPHLRRGSRQQVPAVARPDLAAARAGRARASATTAARPPGLDVPIFYDPMISKLVAWAEDRPRAIARMRRALGEYLVTGIKTTVPFFTWLLAQPEFLDGPLPHHLSRRGAEGAQRPAVRRADARRWRRSRRSPRRSRPCCRRPRWPVAGRGRRRRGRRALDDAGASRGPARWRPRRRDRSNAADDAVRGRDRRPRRGRSSSRGPATVLQSRSTDAPGTSTRRASTRTRCRCWWTTVVGRRHRPDRRRAATRSASPRSGRRPARPCTSARTPVAVTLNGRRRWGRQRRRRRRPVGAAAARRRRCRARSCACSSQPATRSRARQPVVVVEAMKMENELRAGRDGTVAEIHAREGDVGRRRRAARSSFSEVPQAPPRVTARPLRQRRARAVAAALLAVAIVTSVTRRSRPGRARQRPRTRARSTSSGRCTSAARASVCSPARCSSRTSRSTACTPATGRSSPPSGIAVALDWVPAFARRPEITITSVEMTDWQMLVEKWDGRAQLPALQPRRRQAAGRRSASRRRCKYLRASRGQFTLRGSRDAVERRLPATSTSTSATCRSTTARRRSTAARSRSRTSCRCGRT